MPHTTPPQTRILLIDDHAVVRSGLRLLIESHPGWIVIGEAGDCAAALECAGREQPDIIILDLALGQEDGLDLLPELLSSANGARVLVLTGLMSSELHRRAIRLGAKGIVLKEKAVDVLIEAIDRVNAGEIWLDRLMASLLVEELHQSQAKKEDPEAKKIASLTAREREVIVLVCTGLKNKMIADRLAISESTVRNHLTSVLSKLGLADRFALALYAFRYGLAQPPEKV